MCIGHIKRDTRRSKGMRMNHRLVVVLCALMSIGFCFISAGIKKQKQNKKNVVTTHVQQPDNHEAFFQALVKHIDSDRIKYKDNKIHFYEKPELGDITNELIVDASVVILAVLSAIGAPFLYANQEYPPAIFVGCLSLVFMALAIYLSHKTYIEYFADWINKNSLICFGIDEIINKNGTKLSWNDITDLVQYQSFNLDDFNKIKTNSIIKYIDSHNEEKILLYSKYSNELIEILDKIFYYIKQKKSSLENPMYL